MSKTMIIFLFGKEDYLITEKVKEIKMGYKKVHGQSLNLETMEATDFKDFYDAFSQKSMFVKKNLFILENVFSNDKFKKAFAKSLKEFVDSSDIILLIERKTLKKSKFLEDLKKNSKHQEFENVNKRDFAQKEFQKYGTEIERDALEYLLFICSDLWVLSSEIKKMSLYTSKVEKKHVDMFLQKQTQSEIFRTIDAIAEKDKKTALKLIENHIENGDSPFYLLTMITYQFRNLLLVKSTMDKRGLGIHPFALRKLTALSHKFEMRELKDIFNKIFETDFQIKTGKILPEQGIKSLIISI